MSEREESYLTDVEEFSESGGTDPSDSSRISSNDSDGNEELGVQPYLYEPDETNTEGNVPADCSNLESTSFGSKICHFTFVV